MERVTLPLLTCPFPAYRNPHTERVEHAIYEWVQRIGLVQHSAALQHFASARFAAFTGNCNPIAPYEMLLTVAKFFVWQFTLDDHFDKGELSSQPEHAQALLTNYHAILSGALSSPPEAPSAAALYDFWQGMSIVTTPAWQKRFAIDIVEYLTECGWEAQNRVQNKVPTLDLYIEKRQKAGGIETALDFIPWTWQVSLPDDIYKSPDLKSLHIVAGKILLWTNDLLSLHKELAHGEVNNIALVLQATYNSSLQEAVERGSEMLQQEIGRFQHISQWIVKRYPEHSQALETYIIALQTFIRGNLDWSYETGRYAVGRDLAVEVKGSYVEAILPG